MKHKAIYLAAVILLGAAGLAQAQEGELHGTFDLTYSTRYIWRGFDLYDDDHSVIRPSIDLDLFGTGFGTKVLWARPTGSGNENNEWLNYTIYYSNSLYEGESYVTDYTVGWGYYNFPDESRKTKDLQDFYATLSWPDICPAGFVPSYTVIRLWPAKSNSTTASDWGGWMHIFGLGYDLPVSGIIPEIPEHIIHLSANLVYNDGILTGDHEWSHVLFGASTDVDLGHNLTFTPGLYYQATMDDSLNRDDEAWVSLSVKYAF